MEYIGKLRINKCVLYVPVLYDQTVLIIAIASQDRNCLFTHQKTDLSALDYFVTITYSILTTDLLWLATATMTTRRSAPILLKSLPYLTTTLWPGITADIWTGC